MKNNSQLYILLNLGIPVTEEDLKNIALLSGVLNTEDYITNALRQRLTAIEPHPETLGPEDYIEAYLRLKYTLK